MGNSIQKFLISINDVEWQMINMQKQYQRIPLQINNYTFSIFIPLQYYRMRNLLQSISFQMQKIFINDLYKATVEENFQQ